MCREEETTPYRKFYGNIDCLFSNVRKFHYAFNHPVSKSPTLLTDERMLDRISWMEEELQELKDSDNIYDDVDALIDFLYFLVGTMVEMGALPWEMRIYKKPPHFYEGDLNIYEKVLHDYNKEIIIINCMEQMHVLRSNKDFFSIVGVMRLLFIYITTIFYKLGIDPQPVWNIVQNANMAKLFEDGKPRYRESDGKVIKPEGWQDPQPLIKENLDLQIEGPREYMVMRADFGGLGYTQVNEFGLITFNEAISQAFDADKRALDGERIVVKVVDIVEEMDD